METKDFYFDLPEELIAQTPLKTRSDSRLLVLDRKSGALRHDHFYHIASYLKAGDCLVLNDTKVLPARLLGAREDTGTHVELLLLKRLSRDELLEEAYQSDCWEVLVRPGKRVRPGHRLTFGEGLLKAEVLKVMEGGNRIVHFEFDGIFEEILDRLGQMPLPPYIHERLEDPDRYQTVYAREEGSAAAPTAGLHFTKELLEQLKEKGIRIAFITLHVGLGTFRPVKVEKIEDHEMHSEYYQISQETADIINETRREGGRVIAVGTTSCRTLESAALEDGTVPASSGWTQIFIYPGYRFKVLDGLITNFHLPESTLIMLVSAFAGREHVLHAYAEAVRERYRFFSFGDCMLIQ
ncbi:MAG: tRNA preQ1(34) S-adenosylmethionine ribosyltransferase-isomerase QueA [Clostridiales bacterium]|nr:tRNA preQ1(34) S-adenosylmethionine ribosyltransferase-isomerase QueA [Clostridiales bacterium]